MKTLLLCLIPIVMYAGHREVYLFYNGQGSALKDKQVSVLNKDRKGLEERDIILHIVEVGHAAPQVQQWRINTAAAFTFLLIGKDGGEKFRTDTLVTSEKLFAIIDAMPMRKREMKKE